MSDQETLVTEAQIQSESPQSTQDSGGSQLSEKELAGEQSLDERIEKEREEIKAIDEANKEEPDKEAKGDGETGEQPAKEEEVEEEYKPNLKFKVKDTEKEFDAKLAPLLTKETEPIIRELYEKAHGIDEIKASRDLRTRERDEVQGNYNNLVGEVARTLNYRNSGDLQSFFEAVQLTDDQVAKYILEKVRISQLPPEQQVVYNERETLRRRQNALEQQFHSLQAQGSQNEVQATLSSLDSVLGDAQMKRLVGDFDTRNGGGKFREAVINWAAAQPKVLSAPEAVSGFMKTFGLSVPTAPKTAGADPTRRVVTKPKVKTIPNYGGGQASVTATKKPGSVADLRKLYKEMSS